MLYLKKLYLDGTPLEDIVTVAEFSRQHAAPALSWSLGSDRPDGTQTAYTLTLTDLDSRKVLYESGRIETAAQTATFPAGDFPSRMTQAAPPRARSCFSTAHWMRSPAHGSVRRRTRGTASCISIVISSPSSRWRTQCCIPAGWATTRRT